MIEEKDFLKNYIIRQLGRTKKKNFENYCITRIYHLLDRSDIRFSTQQMFKRDNKSIALADLYLPQVDLIVEVDEGHHDSQKEADEKRTEEIIKNKLKYFEEVVNEELQIERIEVAKSSLAQINLQIDDVVEIIKKRIIIFEDKSKFVPWKRLYQKPKYYVNMGYIDTVDNPAFRTIQEVSELFNKGYSGTQRCWFKDKEDSTIMIWCPKMKLNGFDYGGKWENIIDIDGKTIYEHSGENFDPRGFIKDYYENDLKFRYVFAKFRDSSGLDMYRFRGIFELDPKQSKEKKKAVWVKRGNKIDLNPYFKK